MTFIDRTLLDLTERFCRAFQRLTGRTNVWIAVQLTNLSIVVYFVWAGAYIFGSTLPFRLILGVFCAGLLYVLSQTVLKVPVEASEQSAYQRVSRGLRNPRRVRDALLRILFLTLALVLAGPVALVYSVLQLPAALLGYWATEDGEYAERYQTARRLSWNELKDMLGLEDEGPEVLPEPSKEK